MCLCPLLQTTLSYVELKAETANKNLRCKVREVLLLEGDMENMEQRGKAMQERLVSIERENEQLQIQICEEEKKSSKACADFHTYRAKMEGHRAAVLHAPSLPDHHKELMEKKIQIMTLKQKKEELRKDLEDPNGNTVQTAKVNKILC